MEDLGRPRQFAEALPRPLHGRSLKRSPIIIGHRSIHLVPSICHRTALLNAHAHPASAQHPASSSTCTCRPLILDQELLRHKLRQRQRERRFSRCAAIARSLTSLSLSLSSLSLHSPPSSTSLSLAGSAAALRRLLKSLGGRTDGRGPRCAGPKEERSQEGRKEGRSGPAALVAVCVHCAVSWTGSSSCYDSSSRGTISSS